MQSSLRIGVALLAVLALSCLGSDVGRHDQRRIDIQEIVSILQATAVEWNSGNLDGFIAPYDSASTFMSRTGPIDRARMKENYRSAYFKGSKPEQTLRFEEITVRPLLPNHAVMSGRYVLAGGGKPDQSGWFTLVWARTVVGWKIVHDHSS